jgi:hypothetical protein
MDAENFATMTYFFTMVTTRIHFWLQAADLEAEAEMRLKE